MTNFSSGSSLRVEGQRTYVLVPEGEKSLNLRRPPAKAQTIGGAEVYWVRLPEFSRLRVTPDEILPKPRWTELWGIPVLLDPKCPKDKIEIRKRCAQ